MTITGKLLGAAAIGGGATYLMNGDWSRKAKARGVASSAFGWASGVLILHLFPAVQGAPVEVQMAIVCSCCGLVGYVFDRLQGLRIAVKTANIEVESKEKEADDGTV